MVGGPANRERAWLTRCVAGCRFALPGAAPLFAMDSGRGGDRRDMFVFMAMPLLRAVGRTDVGRMRGHNEDFFLSVPELGLHVVCDGMGGHAAGDVASSTAARTLEELLQQSLPRTSSSDEVVDALRSAFVEANRRVHALGVDDPARRGAGTTCTALVTCGGKGVMAHVGDSRLYLARGSALHQLSDDHTFVAEAVRHGIITPQQAAESEHSNVVTRAVGPQEQVLVDTLVFDILPGDTLLLCSDGLSQYFEREPDELRMMLETEEIAGIAESLVEKANERGGSDNITALVLRMDPVQGIGESEAEMWNEVTATLTTLTHIQLFSELTHAELSRVSGHLEEIDVEVGDEVVRQGEVSQGLYIVVRGTLEVVREAKRLARLEPGHHFGEMALLNQRPRTATVVAKTPCRLLYLSRERFFDLVQADHVIGIKFLWRLGQTLSLRLEDVYERPREQGTDPQRTTLTFGRFPSPFRQG